MSRKTDKIINIFLMLVFCIGVLLVLLDYSKWWVLLCPISIIIIVIKPVTICELI
jgi:fatty acid desaturase